MTLACCLVSMHRLCCWFCSWMPHTFVRYYFNYVDAILIEFTFCGLLYRLVNCIVRYIVSHTFIESPWKKVECLFVFAVTFHPDAPRAQSDYPQFDSLKRHRIIIGILCSVWTGYLPLLEDGALGTFWYGSECMSLVSRSFAKGSADAII